MLKWSSLRLRVLFIGLLSLLLATPASAHHAMDGRLPMNGVEGFLSGLAHPVIGLDHLAFVVAAGLLAVTKRQGLAIPIAFVVAALGGTGIHLMGVNLPGAELLVAASVLSFGVLLALPSSPNLVLMAGLAGLAGIFHGYAYGESIVGAENTAVVAYLLGFTAMQLAIALGSAKLGRLAVKLIDVTPPVLRNVGFVLSGFGAALLVSRLGL